MKRSENQDHVPGFSFRTVLKTLLCYLVQGRLVLQAIKVLLLYYVFQTMTGGQTVRHNSVLTCKAASWLLLLLPFSSAFALTLRGCF